jgi:hypothetical protein
MGDIETAVRYSKEIEGLLEMKFGAAGRGLHEKLTSIEGKLSDEVLKNLRYIATIRNKVVHENDFEIKNLPEFSAKCDELVQYLKQQPECNRTAFGESLPQGTFREFLTQLQRPAMGVMAMFGGIWGATSIGVGAGILGMFLGAAAGLYFFSDPGITFLIKVFNGIVGVIIFIAIIAGIAKWWDLGHSKESAAATSKKTSAESSASLKKKLPAAKPKDTGSTSALATPKREN